MRYWTQGTDARTVGALMPILPPTPRATTNGVVRVYGQPGTQGIASPAPAGIPMNGFSRATQPSNMAPDYIFPSIYYTTPDGMHPPVNLFRDNPMPVPARGLYRIPRVLQRPRRTGGSLQVGQPAVVQRWASLGGRNG